MNTAMIITLCLLGTMSLCAGILVIAIAGKDIFFAFCRFFNKKGSDIWIANSNKVITKYYRTPKEDQIKIGGTTYLVNPKKVLNMTEYDKETLVHATKKRTERISKRIEDYETEKLLLEKQLGAADDHTKGLLQSQIASTENKISTFQSKLRLSKEVYLYDKRTAIFYMEGDPIPKDFHEFYSNVDCQVLDNTLKRAMTKPPQEDDSKEMKTLKLLCLAALGTAGVCLIYVFMTKTTVDAIALAMGVQ